MTKYGYKKQDAAYTTGAVYDVSMILSPFLGFLIVSASLIQNFTYKLKMHQ